jgi:cytochrome c oxidase subunit 3
MVNLNSALGNKKHGFHIVTPSPWPFTASIGALGLTLGGVLNFHLYSKGFIVLILGLFTLLFTKYFWWRDVVREGLYIGDHTKAVQGNLRLGMMLFILSEVMFFASFFWAFFHSSLAPAVELGSVWPPYGINVFDTWQVPFLNTVILLASGATLTWCHAGIITNNYNQTVISGILTLALACLFTELQGCEYLEATFTISDGVYGSTFFMATGFHGFHVIIGTIFIFVSLVRYINFHFWSNHHLGFEASAWYWHFVDVVWLFLFISIYWWGNSHISNKFITL